MFPLRDSTRTRLRPYVLYVLLGLNLAAYGWQTLGGNEHLTDSVERLGLRPILVSAYVRGVPAEFDWRDRSYAVEPTFASAMLPFLSSMFLHGGLFHLLSNLWFLWIFADNVEGRLGHALFLILYLLTGLAAGVTHVGFALDSPLPCVGASGAVSGVLGAYLVFFPRARVLTLVPLGIIFQLTTLPAVLFLLLWFGLQILQAVVAPPRKHRCGLVGAHRWLCRRVVDRPATALPSLPALTHGGVGKPGQPRGARTFWPPQGLLRQVPVF